MSDGVAEDLAGLYAVVRPHLDERQRRVLLGAHAARLGRGGIKAVAAATGAHPDTVARGVREAAGQPEPRVRAPGAGRKPVTAADPALVPALLAMVEPGSRGDPESPLRWTLLSTRTLARELAAAGHRCSPRTVASLLKAEGYSLQGNAKVAEGRQHPDRDAQFRYIAGTAREYLDAGDPVVSVDAKKKEKVGNFASGGAEWRPKGRPERVNVHDFPSDAEGKAIPYGIYDLGANSGWVSVGTDHDTSAFAAQALRRWWRADGQARYPHARRLLICADSGGSNAARARAWKVELARLAAETGLEVTCCHYPPGTSKWNKVEHRLFAQITRNWRGRPLISHQAIIELISATTTTTGLTVHAELDTGSYETGLTYTPRQISALPITRHDFHGDWNYTVRPEPHQTPIPKRKQATRPTKHQLILRGCYVPHIYTDQELAALFAQTDRCHYDSQVPFRHLVMPVLFRTIYACGLRASEARLLRFGDVDLGAGVLTIRDGKGGKDRQVPLSAPLRDRLADYHGRVAGRTGGDWFFPGTSGRPLTVANIDKNFRRFLWQARIPHGGRGHGPRVHDLRHAMAVNNLRSWFARGEDVGALLPVLQAYMGHSTIADTDYYLRLTAESYPHITAQIQRAFGDVVPRLAAGPCHGD